MTTETQTDEPWVIWSFEHDAWWAADRRGYTRSLAQAGRYPEALAKAIEADANIVHRHEWALSLADACSILRSGDEA